MPTATPTAPDTQLAATLRISLMRLARRLRAQRAHTDLTLSQTSALATVERHGPLTLGELAAYEKVQPPSMTRIVGVLTEHEVLVRAPHDTDGRQVILSITDSGRDLLREDRRRREAWLAQHLRHLDPDEIDLLRAAAPVLEKLATT
jgi:DNA-binding MarR family transcriptional regulator